jgi:hypothetical protein
LRIGWAFFLLALIVVFAYGLNRGIYLGSSVVQLQKNTGTYYYKHCRYLFPSGVTVIEHGGWDTDQEAANDVCLPRLRRISQWIVSHLRKSFSTPSKNDRPQRQRTLSRKLTSFGVAEFTAPK